MYSAFQFGFQAGFQVVYAGTPTPAPNGNSRGDYVPRSYELQRQWQEEEANKLRLREERLKEDRRANEIRVEELELQRLREGLDDKRLQFELIELLKAAQMIEAQLLTTQAELKLLLLNEETLLVLLMSNPLN